MDMNVFVIATQDSRIVAAARSQSGSLPGLKSYLEFGPAKGFYPICLNIRRLFPIGSHWRLAKLHICAHGNIGGGFVELGTGLRALQTRSFQAIRRCWINTGTVDPGACIEMNVCSAAGYGMTPIMIGLAKDAGVPIRACPVPIQIARMFTPAAGFRTFHPARNAAISAASDYVDVETALSR